VHIPAAICISGVVFHGDPGTHGCIEEARKIKGKSSEEALKH
jgi:hypothetical protein